MTNTELIPRELAEMVAERDVLLANYKEIKVVNDITLKVSAGALKNVAEFRKRVEDIAKIAEKPLKDDIARIRESKDFLLGECADVERYIRLEQGNYQRGLLEAQRKEQEHQNKLADNRAKKAEEKGLTSQIPEIVPTVIQAPAKTVEADDGSKVTFATIWKAERIPGREADIPQEYFQNEDVYKVIDIKVGAVARATKGAVKVPGYRIFSVQSSRVG